MEENDEKIIDATYEGRKPPSKKVIDYHQVTHVKYILQGHQLIPVTNNFYFFQNYRHCLIFHLSLQEMERPYFLRKSLKNTLVRSNLDWSSSNLKIKWMDWIQKKTHPCIMHAGT